MLLEMDELRSLGGGEEMIVVIKDARGGEAGRVRRERVAAITNWGINNVIITLFSGAELKFESVRYTDVKRALDWNS